MDTTDCTNKAPYLQKQGEIEQVTVDAYYHNDLIEIAKLTKEYFKIFNFPIDKTNEELLKMYNIKKQLNKLL
jgi:beta-xylosidase